MHHSTPKRVSAAGAPNTGQVNDNDNIKVRLTRSRNTTCSHCMFNLLLIAYSCSTINV